MLQKGGRGAHDAWRPAEFISFVIVDLLDGTAQGFAQ
jgi:hypothetical protein